MKTLLERTCCSLSPCSPISYWDLGNAGLNLCLPLPFSGSGLWLLSPPFRYLFSSPTSDVSLALLTSSELKGGSCEGKSVLSDSGSRLEPGHFRLLNSERNAQDSVISIRWFFHGVYPVALIEADGLERRWKRRLLYCLVATEARMERGELGCRNRRGWKAGTEEEWALGSSLPLSSQDALSCKMPLDHIENQSSSLAHSGLLSTDPPRPARGSVPRAVERRQRQEAAEWSWALYSLPHRKVLCWQ